MRYVFILNPAAGKGNPAARMLPEIEAYCGERGLDFCCAWTGAPKHATALARAACQTEGAVRIYGCGGDGTLSEIAAGVVGMHNAEIGIFPCGSGDDYIKTFGGKEDFLSVKKQLAALSRPVDLIRSGSGYAMNICSVGLDATVACEMTRFKKIPLVTGTMAYNLALVKVFLGRVGDRLTVELDREQTRQGKFLFVLAGSGRYYGGGFCGAPAAVPDDGLLDFVVIRMPSLYKVPELARIYKQGGHLTSPKFQELLEFHRGKSIRITAESPVAVNLDGECLMASEIFFEVVPKAVRFIVPD